MPNRIIRESCRTSATLYKLSDGAERLFWRLTTVADDYGRFEADPQIVRSQCFPLWPEARLKTAKVVKWVDELIAAEIVILYVSGGKTLGYFPTWEKYQHVRAKASRFPPPTDATTIRSQMFSHVPVSESESVSESVSGNTSPPQQPVEPAAPVDNPVDDWGKPEALQRLYNDLTPEDHPKVKRLSPGRAHKARAYLKIFPEKSFWVRVFSEIRFSTFLCRGSPGSPNFRADFDWLLTKGRDGSENAVKVSEGKYRDR